MSEFAGLGLLRRAAGGDLRHPARRPVDRPADAHRAAGHRLRRRPLARRHASTSCCCRRRSTSATRWRMDAFDLAERLQTLVFVMSDLDLGMNTWMSRAVRVSREAARSRQGARRRDAGSELGDWGRYKDVDGDGIPYRIAAGHRHAGVLHARLGPQREGAVQRAAGRLRQEPRSAGAQVRHGARRSCRAPVVDVRAGRQGRHHRLRHDALGDRGEPRPAARGGRARDRRTCGCAPIRSRRRSASSSTPHDRVYVVEQNRDAQMLGLLRHGARRADRIAKLRKRAALQRPADRRASGDRRHPARRKRAVARRRADERQTEAPSAASRTAIQTWTPSPSRPRRPTASASSSPTYRGSKTTLCAGCGHNAISERIIDAFFEMGVDPKRVIKLSGIGCSSKSPAYFLGPSHGFNSVHGRMPSVATGALLANKTLLAHRRQRRRRHRRDRHRPVRAPDAAQPAARSTSSRTTAATA